MLKRLPARGVWGAMSSMCVLTPGISVLIDGCPGHTSCKAKRKIQKIGRNKKERATVEVRENSINVCMCEGVLFIHYCGTPSNSLVCIKWLKKDNVQKGTFTVTMHAATESYYSNLLSCRIG